MNTIEKITLTSSSKLKQWIKKIQTCIIDEHVPSRSEIHSDVVSPLLGNMDDETQKLEAKSIDTEGNVDIIMKTLRNDVLDIVQDVDCQKKPSWIIYKLDTLENNIRESCNLQHAWINHPVIREELLKAQEKYIVHLIEEIMDDVFQAWNNMRKRKKLGKERSINSVVSVLRILKKEVCRMLQVLNMTEAPSKKNVFGEMKSKSYNDCLFQPAKPCIWQENVQIHSQVTNEINVFGSKSFPIYSPKDNYHSKINFNSDETAFVEEEEEVIDIQGDVIEEILSSEPQPLLPPTKLDEAEEVDLEDEFQIHQPNDAYVFSQYAQDNKCSLPRFLSKLVPSRDNKKAKRKISKSENIAYQESAECSSKTTTNLSDASTLTDETGMSVQERRVTRKDSECNTSSFFPGSIETVPSTSNSGSYWRRSNTFSNKLYCNRRAWVSCVNKDNLDESIMSHSSIKQSESLPAIEIIRKQPQQKVYKPTRNWMPDERFNSSQKHLNELEISEYGYCKSDSSDSEENYFSCVPSETDFNFSKFFFKLKKNNYEKMSETNNFSCRSPKLGEIERRKRRSHYKNSIVHSLESEDIPQSYKENEDFCTIAYLEENPQKEVPSLTPDVSNFSFDSHGLQCDNYRVKFSRGNSEQETKRGTELLPMYSYISDSQFSNLCLSVNSYENLNIRLNNSRIDELIEAG